MDTAHYIQMRIGLNHCKENHHIHKGGAKRGPVMSAKMAVNFKKKSRATKTQSRGRGTLGLSPKKIKR